MDFSGQGVIGEIEKMKARQGEIRELAVDLVIGEGKDLELGRVEERIR